MQIDRLERLEYLTVRLSEVPDGEAPPIPPEWLMASGGQKQGQTAKPVEGKVEQ
jgi:hypothetical protein